jgi:hypothetical protein
MTKTSLALVLVAGLVGLTGCGKNAMIGSWRADPCQGCTNAPAQRITVDDDLGLTGQVEPNNSTQYWICHVDGDVDEKAEKPYRATFRFTDCNFTDCGSSGEAECDMNGDEDRIDCTVSIGSCSGTFDITFDKQD